MAIKGNLVVGQSGGPTAVINQSLVGVVQEARRHGLIDILGLFPLLPQKGGETGLEFGIGGVKEAGHRGSSGVGLP